MYSGDEDSSLSIKSAVRDGDVIKVKKIIEQNGLSTYLRCDLIKMALSLEQEHMAKMLIEQIAHVEETPLHLACRTEWNKSLLGQNVEIAKLLIENGAQVDAQDEYGRTPLHYCRDIELARTLLDKNASVEVRDESGLTPLIRMLSNRRDAAFIRSCFELIDKYGVKPDRSEQYCLLQAWVDGDHDDEGFRELLKHGIDARTRSNSGQTVLHYAVQYGQASVVGTLKRYGIDVNAVDDKGRTLIHTLLDDVGPGLLRWFGMDELLRDNPEIDVNIEDNNARTPLIIAIGIHGKSFIKVASHIIELLLDHGAKIFTAMSDGKSVFHKATPSVQRLFINHITKHGRMMDIIDKCGNTALHAISQSYESNDFGSSDDICLDGLDVNVVNKLGETPLQLASKAGRMATVKLLLDKGASKLIGRTIDGLTPLHMAIVQNMTDDVFIDNTKFADIIARHLVQGLGIDTRDKIGKTPLHYAIESRDHCKVRLLLDNGADVNAADHMGKNALYRVIESGSRDVLELILDRGVDVSSRFFDGTTSLHLVIRFVLNRGGGCHNYENFMLALLKYFGKNHLDPDLLQEYDINTPLYYAMQRSAKLPEAFIRCGASLDKIYWIDGGRFLFLYLDNCKIEGIVEDAFNDLLTRLYAANLGESKYYIRSWLKLEYRDADYKEKCHKEVEKLRRCKISDQLSYYDFLHTDDPFAAEAIMDTKQGIYRVPVDFPIYAGLIKSKVAANLYRANLLQSATVKLVSYLNRSSYIPQGSSLPVDVVSRILAFLNNHDLLRISKPDSCNPIRSLLLDHQNVVSGYRRVGEYIFPIAQDDCYVDNKSLEFDYDSD